MDEIMSGPPFPNKEHVMELMKQETIQFVFNKTQDRSDKSLMQALDKINRISVDAYVQDPQLIVSLNECSLATFAILNFSSPWDSGFI